MNPTVVILAAGLGTRMKSGTAKALHSVAGRPLVQHVLNAAAAVDPGKIVIVLGHQADKVRKAVEEYKPEYVLQYEQLGTGHAVRQAKDSIAAASGPVMILCADTPLLTGDTLKQTLSLHEKTRAAVTLITAEVENPFGYGRVMRSKAGLTRIVEEKDASGSQKKIREINAGIYCFDRKFLLESLDKLGKDNAQGEYYLPDTIALAKSKKLRISALVCLSVSEVLGVNTREDLARAEALMRDRINRKWMLDGVTMPDPSSVFVGDRVVLGKDTILYPNVHLEGTTAIGEGCVVYPGARVSNSVLGPGVTVNDCSIIEDSNIAAGASVGPFARLRPGSVIGERARIGNFVEIKKTTFGEGSKANHLSYIGDATIGKDVNIGAGVITCNYDGFDKHPTVIEDGVFVGSDSQLVAPLTIGKGALIAAGATITRDVPPDALAISRVPQDIREGFAGRRRRLKQKNSK